MLTTFLIQSTFCLTAAWLITRWCRRAQIRERAWRLALLAPFLTVAISWLLMLRLAGGATEEAFVVTARRFSPGLGFGVASPEFVGPFDGRGATAVVSVWAVVAGWLLLRAVFAQLRTARIAREPVTDPHTHDLLAATLRAQRCTYAVRLSCSAEIASPGVLSSKEICLPRVGFGGLPNDQQAALMAHEVAHLVRRDPLWVRVMTVISSIAFFQPLVHLAVVRLREQAELLSDQNAVRGTGAPLPLAEALLSLATRAQNGRLPPAAAATTPSGLTRRVGCLLGPRISTHRRARIERSVVHLCSVGLVMLMVALPGPTHRWLLFLGPDDHAAAALGALSDLRVRVKLNDSEFVIETHGVEFDPVSGDVRSILPDGWLLVERRGPAGARTWRTDGPDYTDTPEWAMPALRQLGGGPRARTDERLAVTVDAVK